MTVLTAEQLDDNMVEEIKDLVRFEPGVPVNEDAVMPVARAMITVTAKLVLAGFDLTGLSHAVSGS
ncbi:hypothetical protein [Sphingomonas sp.]|uniref:hypothetical protein n=1 Tax=Sphingomonas sp. TaxID=28214 RepID=UPI00307E835B